MFKSFQISRRSFVQRCTLTAAATGLPLWFIERDFAEAADQSAARLPSPNDRPNIALIGCGGMGTGDGQNATRFGNLVAVCDVDENHLNSAAKRLSRNTSEPAKYTDFRKVLERDDIHIIINGTPDHWHTLINMAAAKAKKDVYGEKPLTLTIDEGKRLVQTVRDRKTVLQTGSQQRSDRQFRLACELVRNGRIGKLQTVTVYLPAGLVGGPFQSSPTPAGLNWDMWLGQAPKVDYVKERCHSTFRWWFEYSGGPMTDWGAHHNDIARWAMGLEAPTAVEGRALTKPVEGGFNTPSEFEVTFTWANGVTHIVKTTKDDSPFGQILKENGQRNGIKFEGSEGWIWVNRAELDASNVSLYKTPLPDNAERLEVSRDHMGNFFECVRSRKDPVAHAEIGHRSASVCHLAAIAVRLGRKLQWDGKSDRFVGDGAAEGNALVVREMRKPYDYSITG
ncbi:MAG TPA: Gfo/Idh/MocA family oxidoreductase [Candidatus Paceibacterota bacterium]|nr:Gfo/Idh/MocA family oxidoreductase [Verrucomicrobiota bacterium]HRY51506.1 Gfo/Idh/MocA family oxidoreductase [Candidatus Paceibacterota bacterium]HSA01966.1 Gfo/Idh/MocA family oxidoreductase [Candidatus Paceibacterota bacterium]